MTRYVAMLLRCTLVLVLPCCFTQVELPTCAVPTDCPGDYPICQGGWCLHQVDRCDRATATSGDGCCPLWSVDRSGDQDCVAFQLSLGGNAAGPSIDAVTGDAYVAVLEAGGGPDAQDWIMLARVSPDGREAWRAPVGAGRAADLVAPMITAEGVWVGFEQGLRRLDYSGQDTLNGLVTDAPVPGAVAVNQVGCVAWWSRTRGGFALGWPAQGQGERLWPMEPSEARKAGPVFTATGDHVAVAHGSTVHVFETLAGAAMGEVDLGSDVTELITSSADILGLTDDAHLFALVVGDDGVRIAWSEILSAGASGQVYAVGGGRLMVPGSDGQLSVVENRGGHPEITSLSLPWAGPTEVAFWITARAAVFQAEDGLLRSLHLDEEDGVITLREGWRHTFPNGLIGRPAVDAEGFVSVIDGAGQLFRVMGGVLADASLVWPGVAGDGGQRSMGR